MSAPSIAKGDRVTLQPSRFYDGRPTPNWPDPHYVGTVLRLQNIAGNEYASVRYQSGRQEYELLSRLENVTAHDSAA